jgi:hypothetical protein
LQVCEIICLLGVDIFINDIIQGIKNGIVVEDYPNFPKGACVLVLQEDPDGNPIHVV